MTEALAAVEAQLEFGGVEGDRAVVAGGADEAKEDRGGGGVAEMLERDGDPEAPAGDGLSFSALAGKEEGFVVSDPGVEPVAVADGDESLVDGDDGDVGNVAQPSCQLVGVFELLRRRTGVARGDIDARQVPEPYPDEPVVARGLGNGTECLEHVACLEQTVGSHQSKPRPD